MSYSNFKDPVGLFKRMLTSGNRAAYFTLFREGMGVIFKPLDWLLQGREKRHLRKAAQSDHPALLILGGSRSGTTLLYQTLTQYLPVSYFSNLAASFPRAPISASKLFRPMLRKGKGNFSNYYGSVSGFNGPNDGFPIWNRWLGEDRNAVPDHISTETLQDMQRFFRAWRSAFPQAFLNKNNRNSLCIPWFESHLDEVRYLEIRRNPIYVVQSLILSREAVQGSKYIAWGLKSTDSQAGEDPLRYVDDICNQVYEVEKDLDAACAQIPAARYLSIRYEDFCEDPVAVVQAVARFIGAKALSPADLKGLEPFRHTNTPRVSPEEWARILSCTQALYGQDFTKLQAKSLT